MKHPRGVSCIAITVEARMTSSRLPGKVMLPAGDRPVLYYLIRRLKKVLSADKIVLATTVNAADNVLEEFAQEQQIDCFRGSEDDVLGRVLGAADSVGADLIAEVTGDCVINDPRIIEQNIRLYLCNDCDYVANGHIPSYPGGMGSQVFGTEILRRSAEMTNDISDREHVTLFIRRHPELFRHLYHPAPPHLYWPEIDLSLDEERDYQLLKKIIEYFGEAKPFFSCEDVIKLLDDKPDWLEINSGVSRLFEQFYGKDLPVFEDRKRFDSSNGETDA